MSTPQLHFYRPQRTPPENLEAIFVAREPHLQEILERLNMWRPGTSRQHYLLIGPRGIGKTHLLTLIEHRIRQSELTNKWIPIAIAEDAYKISSIGDLMIEAIRILGQQTEDVKVIQVYNQLRFDDNETRVVDLSLDAFRRFHRQKQVGILLMIENLNRLIERQIKQRTEIHLLRKLLIEEDWLVAICTSPTYLTAVTQPEEPLFEFFHVQVLAEFTPEEQEQMLLKKAALHGNSDFSKNINRFRSRLRALYHFTGGNPRLSMMLYNLVANQSVADITSELDLLLDQLTPFYQDRMKDVSEQEGKVLETMALMPEGCNPTKLAKEARMPSKTVRALLTRLERAGYIRREARRKKRTIYIIPERFFRIWHQMNHSRTARGRIQYLLEFFANWYATKEERNQVWSQLTSQFQRGLQEGNEERVEDLSEYMKYVVDVSKGNEKLEREFDRLHQRRRFITFTEVMRELSALDKLYRNDKDYFIFKGYFLANDLGMHREAIESFQAAIKLKRDDFVATFNKAVALDKLGYEDEAQKTYKNTAALLARRRGKKGVREALPILIQIVRDDSDFELVRISAYVLGRTADKNIIGDISSILRTADEPYRRRHCATALGLLRSKDCLGILLEALNDPAPDVRGSAATALGRIGSHIAVDPLIQLLQDRDAITRASAATALGRIRSVKAVEPLMTLLGGKSEKIRASAAAALGNIIGIKNTVGPLIRHLGYEDEYARRNATRALGYAGSKRAVEPLIRLLEDSDNLTRATAATALGRIGSRRAIEPLINLLKDECPIVRSSAAWALGSLGARRAIECLISASRDASEKVRSNIATALGLLKATESSPLLIDLLKDQSHHVRSSAATSLGQIGCEEAVSPLIQSLKDKFPLVRASAATALGHIGVEEAVGALAGCLKDKDSITRASVATALGRIGDARSIHSLTHALRDVDSNVRISAATALGFIGSPGAIPYLEELLKDRKWNVRGSATLALLNISSEHCNNNLSVIFTPLLNVISHKSRLAALSIARTLMRAAFRTGDLEVIQQSIQLIVSLFSNEEALWLPYAAALEYLKKDRDPEVLERQQLEMREAVQLIVDVFDYGRRQSSELLVTH